MSSNVTVELPCNTRDAKKGPNVVDVGAWLASAKALRHDLANYVPKHRAPGPAI
jgi:hypothetical protein